MGAGSSNPLGATPGIGTTHIAAFTNTEHTRQLMNEIFKYMLNQVSVRDLLQMSKAEECKKYVLFKANSLYQYFHELRIFPSTDSRGLLTFRKVDDLVSPTGDMAKERQSLCLVIAYFYTRVFQIYGALALTLIDDMNFMTSTGLTSFAPSDSDARKITPGFIAQSSSGGAVNQSSFEKVNFKHFKWIRSFLIADVSSIGYKTRYVGSEDSKGYVFFKLDDTFKDDLTKDAKSIPSYSVDSLLSSVQVSQFKIGITGSKDYFSFDIYTQIGPETITVRTGKLTFKNVHDETITTERFVKKFSVEFQQGGNNTSKGTYVIKDATISDVSAYLTELLSQVIVYLKSAVKQRKESTYFTSESRNKTVEKSETGISEHLKLQKMITALSKDRPLGHCIARALQLLKAEPFDNGTSISQICRVKFSDEKEDKVSNRIALPKKGKALSDNPGLFALANLFYDTISIGSPKLTIGRSKDANGKSTFDNYVTFMRNMAMLYGDDIKDESKLEEAGLSSISNKRDAEFCKSDDDIRVSAPATKQIHAIVKTMFQAQIDHGADCYKIINKLFSIQYDQSTKRPVMFKLNNNLIVKGFPELERINAEARNLLVNYYTDCEKKYIQGMKFVLDDKKSKNDAATAQTQAQATKAAQATAQPKAAPQTTTSAQVQPKATVPQATSSAPPTATSSAPQAIAGKPQTALEAAQATYAQAKQRTAQAEAKLKFKK